MDRLLGGLVVHLVAQVVSSSTEARHTSRAAHQPARTPCNLRRQNRAPANTQHSQDPPSGPSLLDGVGPEGVGVLSGVGQVLQLVASHAILLLGCMEGQDQM